MIIIVIKILVLFTLQFLWDLSMKIKENVCECVCVENLVVNVEEKYDEKRVRCMKSQKQNLIHNSAHIEEICMYMDKCLCR